MKQIFGFIGILLKPLLYPLSLIYGLVAWLRNKVYDKGIYNSIEFSVPTISVGNLSVGGTGKTPHIEFLIRLLHYEYKVATMSRGYKRVTSGFRLANEEDTAKSIGDEPLQLMNRFRDIYVTVCEDRMAGIPELMNLRPDTEIILLDDAFQHRSVKPGLNILLTNYHQPFYKDRILPFGRLRESRSGYKRADIIIVTKCPPKLSSTEQQEISAQINPLPDQKLFFSRMSYDPFYDLFTGEEKKPTTGANIILVTGLADPEPMKAYLDANFSYVHLLQYPDHHYFYGADLEEIKKTWQNWQAEEKIVVISEKDAARLALHDEEIKTWGIPFYVLPIHITLDQKEIFEQLVLNYVEKAKEEDLY